MEELRREIIIAQGHDRVYLCGKQKKETSRERGGVKESSAIKGPYIAK